MRLFSIPPPTLLAGVLAGVFRPARSSATICRTVILAAGPLPLIL
ncbi:hypothetical protein, partial [Escherichia coli]